MLIVEEERAAMTALLNLSMSAFAIAMLFPLGSCHFEQHSFGWPLERQIGRFCVSRLYLRY